MPSIIEMSLARLPGLVTQVSDVFATLETHRAPLRKALQDLGFIHKIEDIQPEDAPATVTVDGAMVVNQLAGGDLISTCAVSAEGIAGEKYFSSPEAAPKLLWQGFLPDHTSRVSNAASAVMFLQEMVLLENAEVLAHGMRIIDGAWTSALVSVLSDLLRSPESARAMNACMLDMFATGQWQTGEELVRALNRRMRPWEADDEPGITVAISKSDSQKYYAPIFVEAGVDKELLRDGHMGDRALASLALEPGEMLVPSPMPMTRMLDSSAKPVDEQPIPLQWLAGYRNLQSDGPKHSHYEQLVYLYQKISESLIYSGADRHLIASPTVMHELSQGQWVWSTLFKPWNADPLARPMKVDFVRPVNMKAGSDDLFEYAAQVVGNVSADTIPVAKEPMSQYMADKSAKEISTVAKIAINTLTAEATDERMASAIMGNYRT